MNRNLVIRIAAAAVMAPVALGVAYIGGWVFALFWVAVALAVLWEWTRLVEGNGWVAAGIVYAALLAIAPIVLRSDDDDGFAAIALLFAIVWATDIFGYFVGRAVGGPKLAPRISPNKTWSGAVGGTIGALIAAALAARLFDISYALPMILGAFLSVVSQAGDLFESWIKRRFDAKDTSGLIPGHGGVMDRLDGFWAAAIAAMIIGLWRGGFNDAASALMIW